MKEGKYYCDFNPFMDDDENHYVEVSEGQYYGDARKNLWMEYYCK